MSPVAMDIDENGRIFVVEMPGYPLDTNPTGRVVMLEDTDGDGRPDRATVYADGLVLPVGVMRWKKGILVTAAPNVWYFEDTNGDGRADIRQVVLTGFPFTNPQHTVNTPVYGLDNWIYLAAQGSAGAVVFKEKFGDRGSDIRFTDRDTPRLKPGRFNVRFRPETFQLEALSGSSQFGQAFDQWGHHFTIENYINGRHEVIAARYLQRNPDLLLDTTMQDLSPPENNKVYPIAPNTRLELLTDVGVLTSACSLTPYLGGAFPPKYDRVALLAEPAYNLAHCDVWSDSGATFSAKRCQEGAEFLASTDPWFRPVNFYIGPDGAIYMIDYYRKIIEHPEWMSATLYNSKDLYAGRDKGRIYRIVPDSQPSLPLFKNLRLGEASDEELVRQLANPNIWWRRTAQRLLVERRSSSSVEPLVRLFRESASSLARLHALWTLEGLGKLDTALIEKSLDDAVPGVRENAIRLAEPRLTNSPSLVRKLLRMAGDPDPKVRFQLLCTLGDLDSSEARSVREKFLIENIEDHWMLVAALTVPSARVPPYFEMALRARSGFAERETEGHTDFFRQVCTVIGARQERNEIRRVLTAVAATRKPGADWWRAASLEGLARGVAGKKFRPEAWRGTHELLLNLFESPSALIRRGSLDLLRVVRLPTSPDLTRAIRRAEFTAADQIADAEARADSVHLLTLVGAQPYLALLEKLVDPKEPEPVQKAAAGALGQIKGGEIGTFLLRQWRALTPSVRAEAAKAFLTDPGRTRMILKAVRSGDVQGWTLDPIRHRLFMHDDPEIRATARALLAENLGEREKVLKRYQAALNMNGDAGRGEQAFKRVCAKCHKLSGVGTEVGPDLRTVQNHPPGSLLEDILMPNKAITQNYETYVVERFSGGIVDGIVRLQTPTTITLRRDEGQEVVIPRQDIKRIYVGELSLMPSDLDKQIDVQQMADLLKFIQTAR